MDNVDPLWKVHLKPNEALEIMKYELVIDGHVRAIDHARANLAKIRARCLQRAYRARKAER